MDEDCENVFKGWGNLDTDILVRIFQKYFSLHELTSGLAHVCRGWRVACCDPILWNTLDLSHMSSTFIRIPYMTFIRIPYMPYVIVDSRSDKDLTLILKRSMSLSKRNTRTLIFNINLFPNDDMITYTTRRCPNLRRLVLQSWNKISDRGICDSISFCKKLESLTMPSLPDPHSVLLSIRENCKKFRELKVMGPIDLFFIQNLVCQLPKLKVLSLRCNSIHQDALIKIFEKMKYLEVLNVSHSYIIATDTEIAWSTIMDKVSKLKRFVICRDRETCVMCQRTLQGEGIISWDKYEEGLWKADEVSSLHL